ncbi:alpha/beta hydrolase [Streptomyces sp. NPDC046831]|uniref:alpha/beta fold hydrolase n=1 Tax=Streptomyces sp. NPDC046831 TaxID=3154805 RepID=UPI0033D0BF4A
MPRESDGPLLYVRRDRVGPATVRSFGADGPGAGGRTVVLIPGLGAPGYLLRAARECARHSPVRLLDLPGFADPDGPACPETLGALAGTVARWLAAAPGGPVVLAGHSTGALVALHAAARVPHRVGTLVLLAPVFPPWLRRALPLAAAFARTAVHENPAVLPALLPHYAGAGVGRLVRYLRSAQADSPEDALPSVACPVLVAGGRDDALCPPGWMHDLARRAPRGRVVVTSGAHAFPHWYPTGTAALLRVP